MIGGYFLINLIFLAFDLTVQSRVNGFRLRQDNLQMFLKGIPLTAFGYLIAQFVPHLWLRLTLCSLVILVLLVWLPSSQEKRNGVAYLNRLLSKYLPFWN